ncbi:HNH endonuclease signature motif containing protein [Nocardioides houyundeii]|uniref:HNH endonuclease signature motif containing protein n=1 Tax=Nocardioides houyundeii TaxID=2045452 RepID=UPI000C77FD9A|nr:HNH endonuclease signature motif containing protein [Nocardioides houyundeii]
MDPSSSTEHPVLACTNAIVAALREVAGVDPLFMTVAQKRQALLALDQATTRLHALQLRVTAASADVADSEGHRDIAAWLTARTRGHRATHRRTQCLANAIEHRWHALGGALDEGRVNPDQGHAIARALDDLPTDPASGVTPAIRQQAESHLIAEARHFGPTELRRLGAKILEVVAPDLFEDTERKKLLDQERRARTGCTMSIRDLGDGTALVKARVPVSVATRLQSTLEAFTSPRQRGTGSSNTGASGTGASSLLGEKVPYPTRLGRAFCALLEGLDPSRLPLHGGDATTLVLTMDLTALLEGLGTATLQNGERISAGEARRLACTAKLVPAVLGTASEPLDLGRSARLFSPAQRRALAVRDQTCRAADCDIPATWCEAHHLTPWSAGGATDLADGVLLCSHHHHRIHDDRYLHERLPNGDIRYARRR